MYLSSYFIFFLPLFNLCLLTDFFATVSHIFRNLRIAGKFVCVAWRCDICFFLSFIHYIPLYLFEQLWIYSPCSKIKWCQMDLLKICRYVWFGSSRVACRSGHANFTNEMIVLCGPWLCPMYYVGFPTWQVGIQTFSGLVWTPWIVHNTASLCLFICSPCLRSSPWRKQRLGLKFLRLFLHTIRLSPTLFYTNVWCLYLLILKFICWVPTFPLLWH